VSYLVFARKYRPQTFDEVIGQEHVGKTLRNAIAGGRLAQAYLFCGPRGVGKTTMARILAKAVNCSVSPGAEPCGTCEICTGIAAGSDVDVLEIDAASNRKVEDVEPLVDASRYLPTRATHKIFIVDEAHMLSKHAWNALLKTLEEPPPHVLFVFATTEPQKVIETVRSRCQRFDFRRITKKDIARKLARIVEAEGLLVEPGVMDEIAARSTGGLRDAETMLDQLISAAPGDRALTTADLVAVLGDTPRSVRLGLLGSAAAGDMQATLTAANEIVDAGADAGALLRQLFHDLHDTAVARARGEDAPLGLDWSLAAAEVVGNHLALADRSRAPRATLDLALLAVARLGDVRDLEDLVARLERLSGGASAAPRPADPAPRSAEPAPAVPRAAGPRPPAAPAAPAKGRTVDLRTKLRAKTEERARGDANSGTLAAGPGSEAGPAPATRGGHGLPSEEIARIRALPRVQEVLGAFRGRIEHIRRDG